MQVLFLQFHLHGEAVSAALARPNGVEWQVCKLTSPKREASDVAINVCEIKLKTGVWATFFYLCVCVCRSSSFQQ